MLFRLKKVLKVLCLLIIILLPCNLVRAADTIIVSGYSYDDGGPHIILYNLDKKEYRKQYLNGQKLHLIKTKTHYCIGTYNLVDFSSSPCPRRMLLDPSSKVNNCGECYKKIGFNPSFYNSSYISLQQLEYNKTPHVINIGTTTKNCRHVALNCHRSLYLQNFFHTLDTGFQGIDKFHKNSKKKTKRHFLTKSDKANNRKISSERVQNEHVIAFIKRFRILSEK